MCSRNWTHDLAPAAGSASIRQPARTPVRLDNPRNAGPRLGEGRGNVGLPGHTRPPRTPNQATAYRGPTHRTVAGNPRYLASFRRRLCKMNDLMARLTTTPGKPCRSCGGDDTCKACNSSRWFCFTCGKWFAMLQDQPSLFEDEQDEHD